MRFDSSAPLDSSSDPITGDFLRQALDTLRREIFATLHVAMPGTVISYAASDGTVSVRPALRRRTSSDQILTAPILPRVPVLLPSSDYTPTPGDPCLLLFCDFCLDGFLDTGQPVLPPSSRSHDLSDAFALVGFCPAIRNLTKGGDS